jgi:type IV secretory pathway TraG/TraD family ATPase VirD4
MAFGRKKSGGAAPREHGSQAWNQLGKQDELDSLAYQDVHGDQQLERSDIEAKISPVSREVASAVAGVLVFILVWALFSFGTMGVTMGRDALWRSSVPSYAVQNKALTKELGKPVWSEGCFSPALETGEIDTSDETCYEDAEDVPEPQWHVDAVAAEKADRDAELAQRPNSAIGWMLSFDWLKFVVSSIAGLVVWGLLRMRLLRNLKAQNLMRDTTDINQYKNDQHVALPEEVRERFDVVPDVGAHTGVSATTLISHSMVSNKGIEKVAFAQRAEKDILDEDGDVALFEGEALTDDNGDVVTKMVPMFDEEFGTALWNASGLPDNKQLRRRLDPRNVPYNPGNANRDKLKGFNTLADLVNGEWELPTYEPQRPAGVYYVDTAPANTMILAMTRAGKGQTYIEPMLDIWMRQKRPDNMIINDPKGELLVKNYVRATMRGFQVVQFNLINAMKTDIYNPLGMAAEAAREGDQTKCALYVENIADVFFPVDGAEDPVWPNAANNAFKRAAYGLIDYYLEEEHQLRQYAMRHGMDQKVLEQKLDAMWGKVTLYNCYQLFVQLTSKKRRSPMTQVNERIKSGYYDQQSSDPDEVDALIEHDKMQAERIEFLWEGKPESDLLTLFFNATEALPQSTMRTLIANANNALRAMAGAEKMLASVYGIAITAMSFFTDPTISTLTSGTPSQNTDLGGLSFPRRFGVRFAQNFTKRDGLIGAQAKWDAFDDPELKHNLGKDFEHEDTVVREGWARYYFDGKFPHDVAYLRLRLFNPQTGVLLKTFYFQFTKGYQLSLNGRKFVKDPITGNKIIRNGVLVEMVKGKNGVLVPGHLSYPATRLLDKAGSLKTVRENVPAIILSSVRYSEQPKAVFLVTPPHLMKYAKLVLILVKQLVDLNFDKSYMTKANQKPLYKTRFMLDELGNLQSEGHGIAGFETMLSIGLGQEQQFTLILQTLQQARDVYGDSVDKIIQGNVANIVFLKSTDDTMIETLAKMSGTRHRAVRDSKTVTQDTERLIEGLNVEGKVSYTISAKEESVIGYNDLAFLPERNSIIFSAGISPIWNRNAEILPMSWRLFSNTIKHPGREYSLQTIPTLSSALDFDVRLNQPNFMKMLDKRIEQAANAAEAMELYQEAYDLDDYGISILDPDVYSAEVMDLIASIEEERKGHDMENEEYDMDSDEALRAQLGSGYDMFNEADEINEDVREDLAARQEMLADRAKMRYAEGQISRENLMSESGHVLHHLDGDIVAAYREAKHAMVDDARFFRTDENGSLCSLDGKVYISQGVSSDELRTLRDASSDETSGVYADDDSISEIEDLGSWRVYDAFYKFLHGLESWEDLGGGAFDRAIARVFERRENE